MMFLSLYYLKATRMKWRRQEKVERLGLHHPYLAQRRLIRTPNGKKLESSSVYIQSRKVVNRSLDIYHGDLEHPL